MVDQLDGGLYLVVIMMECIVVALELRLVANPQLF